MITEDEKRFIEEWHRDLADHDQAQRIADAEKKGLEQGIEQGKTEVMKKFALSVSYLM